MAFDFFTSEQIDLLSASTVRCDLGCKFDFASGAKYAWNGDTKLVIGSNTYQPMKGYGRIDGLGMASGTVSESVTLSLSGLPNSVPGNSPEEELDFLAVALAESSEVDQRMVTISLLLFGEDWQIVGSPIPLFHGFMQPPSVTRTPMQDGDGGIQSITLTAENVFFGRARPSNGRNTDRDQQARSPGDFFFGYVWSLRNKTITYPDYSQ
jgi:hypothetical protein